MSLQNCKLKQDATIRYTLRMDKIENTNTNH